MEAKKEWWTYSSAPNCGGLWCGIMWSGSDGFRCVMMQFQGWLWNWVALPLREVKVG